MRILIDADGCPVVDIAVKIAKENGVECLILCDTAHLFAREGAATIIVSKGTDSVDFAIIKLVDSGDIVITQDYGLAAMCLARKAFAINQDGLVYDNSNIDELLLSRYTAKKIRNAGGRLKGNAKRIMAQDIAFEKKLRQLITK